MIFPDDFGVKEGAPSFRKIFRSKKNSIDTLDTQMEAKNSTTTKKISTSGTTSPQSSSTTPSSKISSPSFLERQ